MNPHSIYLILTQIWHMMIISVHEFNTQTLLHNLTKKWDRGLRLWLFLQITQIQKLGTSDGFIVDFNSIVDLKI